MIQKCDGVKILDLEEKLEVTGSEYMVTAEKGNNYKLPLESVADIVIGSSKFKAAIKDVYESSTPTASVSLDKDQFLFSFGIPAGRTGDAGKDGKDGKDGLDGKDGIDGVPGIDGDTTRVVIAYKSTKSIERPDTPVGGSWDYDTNTITYPEGWSGSDSNPNGYVWMSTATFSSKGTIVVPWSTPVRLTGADGHDGADGSNIEFVYKLTVTSLVTPTKPTGNSQTEAIRQGWTDHPTGISEQYQCEWVCSHNLQTDGSWSEWSDPTIWSKWGVNGKDGDGVEYIYQITKLPASPKEITDNNPDQDEYIPQSAPGEQPWTDNPTGVSKEFQYEWVSQRKYKGDTHKWGNFSSPSLWAKYGDNGQDGQHLRVMYTKTSGSDVKPRDPDRLNINPGSIWSVGMPTATGKEAIWGIQALVTFDNKLVIDESLPEEERGWQGPYLITGVPGLDGNNFNYQVEAFKQSQTQPEKPTSNDPYNPGDGWVLTPDMSTGIWWKCIALVQGETGTVIEWGAVVKVTGQGVIIKGTLDSTDDLPTSGNEIGDGWVIDGFLWVWNGSDWVNVGKVQGMDGNYYEYRFARNNSWSSAPSLDQDTRYPSGWSSSAPALSNGKVLWATFAYINGSDNTMIEDWCDPYYMTGMTGDNGGSGVPGVGYEVRYCKGTETTYTGEQWSDTMKRKRDPKGWSIDVPELVSGDEYNYIWFIQCRIINDELESGQYWSKPNPMGGIITPDPVGSQPIAYPMGIYSTTTPYINDGETAPYVYDTGGDTEGNHYFFLKAVMTWIGTLQNNESPGTDTSGAWEPLKNFEAIYTDLLIAPNSLVGGAVFNNNLMFSQRGKNASGGDSSEYHLINTSDPMNTSNSFRPNFLLDFENGEAYFGAGGIHLAADSENSLLLLTTSDTKLTLDGSGLSMINNTGGLSTVGTYIKKNNISLLTGDYLFKLDSTGMRMGQAQTPFTEWFGLNSDGSGLLAKGNITWNSSGEINELNVGDSTHGKVILAGDSFSGLRVPQSTDSDFYLIDIYGTLNLSPNLGNIYVRCSNGSLILISGNGSIYILKVLGSDTYTANLNPTEGLIFAKNNLTTKTYANA
ncbi:hypothetical protein OJM12_gp35 [uncultured phage cr150_1]|uniref:hypothetical protein n=1 Tax=uncultured phage cr150_1 TaxID=2986413 RepID=UPI001C780E25|nr:hypothetical protein OJM12_gp35 [uncultured phage cr150_1]